MLELVPSILALQSAQNAPLVNEKPMDAISAKRNSVGTAVTQQKAPLLQLSPKVDPTPAIAVPESISVPLISASPVPIQIPVVISTPGSEATIRAHNFKEAAVKSSKASPAAQATAPKSVLEAPTASPKAQTVRSRLAPKAQAPKDMVQNATSKKLALPSSEGASSKATASPPGTAANSTLSAEALSSPKDSVSPKTILPVSVEPLRQNAQVASTRDIKSSNESKKQTPVVTSSTQPVENAAPDLSQPVDRSNSQKNLQAQPTRQLADSALVQQQKLLEQRLAEIVAKDKVAKQAKQQEALVARAYQFAAKAQFEQARKTLQDPVIAADVRSQLLETISSMQSASPSKATSSKLTSAKPIQIANASTQLTKASASLKLAQSKTPQVKSRVVKTMSQAPVITRIPVAVQEIDRVPIIVQSRLPQTPVKSKQSLFRSEPKTPQSSDGNYAVVNPSSTDLAYNPTLPQPGRISNPATEVMYPLPTPVPVTSGYGWRTHPVTRVKRFHSGIDLGAAQGTPILATRQGRVTVADRLGGYGLAIVVEHQNGKQDTLYGHLSEIFVNPGQKVEPGAVIGRVGSTGVSTGPHLHYEARQRNGSTWVTLDPSAQLETAKVRLMRANS